MSNKLHSGETDRKTQIRVRVTEQLKDEFDQWVAESSEHGNRSDALRSLMRTAARATPDNVPRQPPTDDERLRDSYLCVVRISNGDAYVRDGRARAEISSECGVPKEIAGRYLSKLRARGYLLKRCSAPGKGSEVAWKIRGVEDG